MQPTPRGPRVRGRTGAPLWLAADASVLTLIVVPCAATLLGAAVSIHIGLTAPSESIVALLVTASVAAGLGCASLAAVSLLLGRRRPSRARRSTASTSCANAGSIKLRVVTDLRAEAALAAPWLTIVRGQLLQNYSRPASGAGVALVWRIAWRCLAMTLAAARRLVLCPGSACWDRWGLADALAQLHDETFTLPLPPLALPAAGDGVQHALSDAVLAAQQPFVACIRDGHVGYRGIIFDRARIVIDRLTSAASLAELERWRGEGDVRRLSGVGGARVVALNVIGALAFPRDVTRTGRHPRAGSHRSTARRHRVSSAVASPPPHSAVRTFRKLASVLQLHNGYCHWVTERLPSLALLLPLLRGDEQVKLLVDVRFHGAHETNPWVVELLELLGIGEERIVRYDPRVVYHAQELYVASPVPANCAHRTLLRAARTEVFAAIESSASVNKVGSAAGGGVTAPVVKGGSDATEMSEADVDGEETTTIVRVVLVSRDGEARVRVLRDAARFAERLRATCNAACAGNATRRRRRRVVDVRVVRCASLSVREQVAHFARADVVIGMHGAGLANCLWMRGAYACETGAQAGTQAEAQTEATALRSGVHLFELLPCSPPSIRYIFWHLATSLGVRYHALVLAQSGWASASVTLSAEQEERFCAAVAACVSAE